MVLKQFAKFMSYADTHPVLFNITTSSTLFGLGDLIQQKLDLTKLVFGLQSKNDTKKGYNYYQTFKIMSYAILLSPFAHMFYTKLLPKIIPVSSPPSTKDLLKKVAADYVIFSSM